eukprot:9126443-Lingulodinium_polyedra.AAC.1
MDSARTIHDEQAMVNPSTVRGQSRDWPWIVRGRSMYCAWGSSWIVRGQSMDSSWVGHGQLMEPPMN